MTRRKPKERGPGNPDKRCKWVDSEGISYEEYGYRSYKDVRISAGFCSGVAEHEGVDTFFLRIARIDPTPDQDANVNIFYLRADEAMAIAAVLTGTMWSALERCYVPDALDFQAAWPIDPRRRMPADFVKIADKK